MADPKWRLCRTNYAIPTSQLQQWTLKGVKINYRDKLKTLYFNYMAVTIYFFIYT